MTSLRVSTQEGWNMFEKSILFGLVFRSAHLAMISNCILLKKKCDKFTLICAIIVQDSLLLEKRVHLYKTGLILSLKNWKKYF